jgi:mRNA-degrading endonuclease YafQ of YafQ-DinJ toxin-antitoxin module
MWHVKIEDEAAAVFKGDDLTKDDRHVIREWAIFVRKNGPNALKRFPQIWADHELHGKWDGYRSSRFSYSGRIIYKVENKIVTVIVVRITTHHNYKK